MGIQKKSTPTGWTKEPNFNYTEVMENRRISRALDLFELLSEDFGYENIFNLSDIKARYGKPVTPPTLGYEVERSFGINTILTLLELGLIERILPHQNVFRLRAGAIERMRLIEEQRARTESEARGTLDEDDWEN